MKKISSSTLKKITQLLVEEFDPDKIILFGSFAWGVPNQNSDLDILVVVHDSNLSPVKRSIKAHRCLRGLNISKDILVKTQSEMNKLANVYASLEAQALEKGKILYARA
ncbi:MAG: nucleotidyltransferase domain-containing protein [Ignavibacteriaceae bacterium]